MSSRRPRTGNRARLYRPRMKRRGLARRARQRIITVHLYAHVGISRAPADDDLPGLVGYTMSLGGGGHTVKVTTIRDGLGRTVHQQQTEPVPPPKPPAPPPTPALQSPGRVRMAPAGAPFSVDVRGADGEWKGIGTALSGGLTLGFDGARDSEPIMAHRGMDFSVTLPVKKIDPLMIRQMLGLTPL